MFLGEYPTIELSKSNIRIKHFRAIHDEQKQTIRGRLRIPKAQFYGNTPKVHHPEGLEHHATCYENELFL